MFFLEYKKKLTGGKQRIGPHPWASTDARVHGAILRGLAHDRQVQTHDWGQNAQFLQALWRLCHSFESIHYRFRGHRINIKQYGRNGRCWCLARLICNFRIDMLTWNSLYSWDSWTHLTTMIGTEKPSENGRTFKGLWNTCSFVHRKNDGKPIGHLRLSQQGRASVKPIFLPLMNYAPEEDDVRPTDFVPAVPETGGLNLYIQQYPTYIQWLMVSVRVCLHNVRFIAARLRPPGTWAEGFEMKSMKR